MGYLYWLSDAQMEQHHCAVRPLRCWTGRPTSPRQSVAFQWQTNGADGRHR